MIISGDPNQFVNRKENLSLIKIFIAQLFLTTLLVSLYLILNRNKKLFRQLMMIFVDVSII